MGYEIGEPFRRKGYGKEAAITLMKWAFEQHGQRCFILSISPSNEASLGLAHSMNFIETGLRNEEGELYFKRRLDSWPNDWEAIVAD